MTDGDTRMSNKIDRTSDVGVLEQRLYSTETNLNRLAEDTNRQIRDLAANTTQQIGNLATSTQQQNAGLAASIGKLDSSLQERGKIPWPAMSVGLGALLAIGTLVYWPIREGQARLETSIIRLADAVPTSREIGSAALRRDDWQRYAEERFKKIEADGDATQKALVPRGEHEEKWRSADIRFADHQRQIDTLRTNFEQLYSPRDALTSMQRRLEDLERRLVTATVPRS